MSVEINTNRIWAAAISIVLFSAWSASGHAAQLPTLPLASVNTTYSPPSGNTITVNAGGNFQAALNNAQLGDTIVLQAGATFTGPFTLPNKTSGSGWIYIRSSAYSSLPSPGNRVSPSDAANMPKITVSSIAGSAAIGASSGAHHYRFVGIELKPAANEFVYDLVTIPYGTSNIIFDRCYIHGDPSRGGRRGININASGSAVVDSYISDFKEVGNDSQAILVWNSPGPIKIVNNYLEAAGENVLFGGVDPSVQNLVPADIEIKRNYFFKPLGWRNSSWIIKNLLEFKNAKRVLVEGNVFENNWAAAQIGISILFTPRNQDGGAPWCTVEDVTFRLNKIKNVSGGFNVGGNDNVYPSLPSRRILIQNNTVTVTRTLGGDGRIFQIAGYAGGPQDVTIDHNTGFTDTGTTAVVANVPKSNSLDFNNNILSRGQYGFIGDNAGEGTGSLNMHFNTWVFSRNAIIGAPSSSYPSNNYFPSATGNVGFIDYAGGNYRLASSSPYRNVATDGKDLGADIDAIEAAIAGVSPAPGPVLPPPPNVRVQ